MDCAASSDSKVYLPPEEVREILQQCFSSAKENLAASRARKILLNIKTARRRAERLLRNNKKCDSLVQKGSSFSGNDSSVPKSIFAIPSHSKRRVTMKSISQCPGGLSWVRIRSNMRAADQGKDNFFVPYIGESEKHQNFSNKLAADTFENDERVPDDISEDEDGEEEEESHRAVRESEPSEKNKRSNQSVKNAKNTRSTSLLVTKEKKKISERVWARGAVRVALKRTFEVLGCSSLPPIETIVCDVFGSVSTAQVAKYAKNIEYRLQRYEEADKEENAKRRYRTEMMHILNGSVKSRPSEILKGDSIPFFVCRQCYTYNCFLHGNHTAKPSKTIPDKTRKDSCTRQIFQSIESRCEDKTEKKCWHIDESLAECKAWWRQVERHEAKAADIRALILELHGVFGADPCRIATSSKFLLDSFHSGLQLTCCRVGYMISVIEGIRPLETKQKSRRRVRKSAYSADSYKRKKMRMEDESGLKGGLRRDFEPCKHSGPCTAKSCPCYLNGVNCEKYCSCNHSRSHQDRAELRLTCPNAFKGCSCKSSVACVSNACICYSWKRECDPDLCKSCHECKGDRDGKSCGNDGLLMGKRKRIIVGHSDTHGWGAFAACPVSKNEIIGEYVGEIVDQEHADRRGRLYDEVQYSFLFNITDDFALDSTRIGNKLRYCNHAFEPNCEARLMRVAGDIRVGLYAKRDIGKHEELYFDYKYKFGPDWAVPTKDKKPTRTYKEKRRSGTSAMKQVSSNQREEFAASSLANGKRGVYVDPPFQTKVKRPRTMHSSISFPAKNEKPEIRQRRPALTTNRKQNSEAIRNVDEQKSKPSSAGGHPVERPLSVWRGVLRRVIPRATDSVRPDRSRPGNCLSAANPTKPSLLEKDQLVVGSSPTVLKFMDKEAEVRESGRDGLESQVNGYVGDSGGRNLGTMGRGQSLRMSSKTVPSIGDTKSLNNGSLHEGSETPAKPDHASTSKPNVDEDRRRKLDNNTQRLRNQRLRMRRRLKEIFGSDDETDEDESEEFVEESKSGSTPVQKDEPFPPCTMREKKRQLGIVGDKEDIISSKRRRTTLDGRDDDMRLGRRLGTHNEKHDVRNAYSFTEAHRIQNGKEFGVDSGRASASRAMKKVIDNASATRRGEHLPGEQGMSGFRFNSSHGTMVEQTENSPESSRDRTKKSPRFDRSRSTSQLSKGEEGNRLGGPLPLRARQPSRECDQRKKEPNIQPEEEPELQIPMVNLISDEESESNSGSFDPKFF
ncbi:Histone-lysine N-methyltransferase [Gracilaria domingensis]|nr:Histone-lysine N-methyltransferase [Gracilaria domingensis]